MNYGEQPIALVTGATGPSGAATVLALVNRGFKVRATTRDISKGHSWMKYNPRMESKVEWLEVADMQTPGSLDAAVPTGCVAVVHCAGPYHWKYKTAPDFCLAAVNGTRSVLKSAAAVGTVKRFILLSSVAAMHYHDYYGESRGSEFTYDESSWCKHNAEAALTTEINSGHYGYVLSKKLQEELALDFMETNKPSFDLVRIHPGTGYGSLPQVTDDYTFADLDAASGRLWDAINHPTVEENWWPAFTSFQDTTDAIIQGLFRPAAGGQRYQLVSGHYDYHMIFTILLYAFPEEAYRLPEPYKSMKAPDALVLPTLRDHFKTDCSKAERELGFTRWRTMEECLRAEMPTLYGMAKKLEAAKKVNGGK